MQASMQSLHLSEWNCHSVKSSELFNCLSLITSTFVGDLLHILEVRTLSLEFFFDFRVGFLNRYPDGCLKIIPSLCILAYFHRFRTMSCRKRQALPHHGNDLYNALESNNMIQLIEFHDGLHCVQQILDALADRDLSSLVFIDPLQTIHA